MARKSKSNTKVKPIAKRASPKLQPVVEVPPFHITFPITLILRKEHKNCYFQCEAHLISYLNRLKLKKTEYKIEPTSPKSES